ncbi:hypothetical protein [Planktothrix sp.]|uniref:hypothetical protein n=1 Tax=Planktothrix sp. TaxID=3088171 RepID=UPI0038D3B624
MEIAEIADKLKQENGLLLLIIFLTYIFIVIPVALNLIIRLVIKIIKSIIKENNKSKKLPIKYKGKVDKNKRL